MKTTIEIPEHLYRKIKARAELEGLSLREFIQRSLQIAIQLPSDQFSHQRVDFPIVRASQGKARLTSEQVRHSLDTDDDL